MNLDMTEMRKIAPSEIEASNSVGSQFGVSGLIHDNDFMYWFDYDNSKNKDESLASVRYMLEGRGLAHFFKDHIIQHSPSRNNFSLLDFASGYGRVSRWMKEALPGTQIFASDVHQDAISFMSSIGVEAFKSSSVPEEFTPPCQFDVILSVSFFTHMPKPTWSRWLKRLEKCLNPGGLLVITTHGDPIWHAMGSPRPDEDGFYFTSGYSEQKDISVTEYGTTYTSLEFVVARAREAGLRVEGIRSPGHGNHDIITLRKADRSMYPSAFSPPTMLTFLKNKFRKRIIR
ncbi:class I SAM-dependent methyltransferase [Methylobacterium sp. WL8]|uniref:class I SAM-dependent methyltransferase n=1 Tax=Methylobacterium sp. WL8 TaxID=2603899 RepID=UPI0011CB28C7|nr:class I SAM-dependent methyltransferase [Methylobacterium sp. WL8]TXN78286.1 methyltransferase domain-containing protein [Methylobacterium sp. WL8]